MVVNPALGRATFGFFWPCAKLRAMFHFFKGLALPWFGLPLADFLQVLAFSGSWFFAVEGSLVTSPGVRL